MNKELVESVLQSWNIANPSIIQIKDYSEETPRIVCRVETETQDYVLKGIPNIPENSIKSNIQAYLFLGNKHSIAPKLFTTKSRKNSPTSRSEYVVCGLTVSVIERVSRG